MTFETCLRILDLTGKNTNWEHREENNGYKGSEPSEAEGADGFSGKVRCD